ncbi:hypothetical protein Q0Z83_029370 [Actinoplanes sichuanensis]|uniref:ATP-binding protein n=1 Tax=Actinoplanes sichuanensis TaxID=512349 RepID=A0ABW4AV49_9ACTN|nr:ATP-binding protein [Actinoplanes sichuanensis]BEL04746.1 hypothetical protein Q0Z83_029370 [Actinoplanes sichuanensis]
MDGAVRVETVEGGRVLVALTGSVLLARPADVLPQVERALKADDITGVDVDLTEVSALDSSGVALLILLRRLTVRARTEFRVRGARPEILQHLNLVGVNALLGLPTTAAADDPGTGPPAPDTAVVTVFSAPFDVQGVKAIRERLSSYATSCGLSGFDHYKLMLAATEIMANVVMHGGGHGTIDVERLADRLRIRVTDQGPGIPRRRRMVRHRPRPGRIGSSGLWLARKVCERVDIRTGPGGTTVLLTYALSPHDE